ncbi:MAG: hypothetical protein ABIB71_04520 [Candidatus Woesearchaeota archaeon]
MEEKKDSAEPMYIDMNQMEKDIDSIMNSAEKIENAFREYSQSSLIVELMHPNKEDGFDREISTSRSSQMETGFYDPYFEDIMEGGYESMSIDDKLQLLKASVEAGRGNIYDSIFYDNASTSVGEIYHDILMDDEVDKKIFNGTKKLEGIYELLFQGLAVSIHRMEEGSANLMAKIPKNLSESLEGLMEDVDPEYKKEKMEALKKVEEIREDMRLLSWHQYHAQCQKQDMKAFRNSINTRLKNAILASESYEGAKENLKEVRGEVLWEYDDMLKGALARFSEESLKPFRTEISWMPALVDEILALSKSVEHIWRNFGRMEDAYDVMLDNAKNMGKALGMLKEVAQYADKDGNRAKSKLKATLRKCVDDVRANPGRDSKQEMSLPFMDSNLMALINYTGEKMAIPAFYQSLFYNSEVDEKIFTLNKDIAMQYDHDIREVINTSKNYNEAVTDIEWLRVHKIGMYRGILTAIVMKSKKVLSGLPALGAQGFFSQVKGLPFIGPKVMEMAELTGNEELIKKFYMPAYRALIEYNIKNNMIEDRVLMMAEMLDDDKKLLKEAYTPIVQDINSMFRRTGDLRYSQMANSVMEKTGIKKEEIKEESLIIIPR